MQCPPRTIMTNVRQTMKDDALDNSSYDIASSAVSSEDGDGGDDDDASLTLIEMNIRACADELPDMSSVTLNISHPYFIPLNHDRSEAADGAPDGARESSNNHKGGHRRPSLASSSDNDEPQRRDMHGLNMSATSRDVESLLDDSSLQILYESSYDDGDSRRGQGKSGGKKDSLVDGKMMGRLKHLLSETTDSIPFSFSGEEQDSTQRSLNASSNSCRNVDFGKNSFDGNKTSSSIWGSDAGKPSCPSRRHRRGSGRPKHDGKKGCDETCHRSGSEKKSPQEPDEVKVLGLDNIDEAASKSSFLTGSEYRRCSTSTTIQWKNTGGRNSFTSS